MFKGFDFELDAMKFRQKVTSEGTEFWNYFVLKGKASRKNLGDAIGAKIASGKWVLSGKDNIGRYTQFVDGSVFYGGGLSCIL